MKDALATPPNDGCLQRTASTDKDAGAVVYLMEELGDARLRCDQLVRYLSEGAKLIEKSSHKDHFFEVAGHLIQAVPVTAFKLQKALQAVALAASRIDYEELKRELKPEKVLELERVLEDVRIRQVQRRSGPLQSLNPKKTAEYLRTLARMSREAGGVMPYTAMASLILALEDRTKEASEPAGDMLDKLAESLERAQGDDQAPSRTVLAAVLRRMLGDANVEGYEIVKEAETDMGTANWKADRTALTIGEKRTMNPEGKKMTPEEVTKDMSKEEAEKWKANTEKHRDKFKKKDAFTIGEGDKRTRHEEGKKMKPEEVTKGMSDEEKAKWEANTDKYKDKFKKKDAADWKAGFSLAEDKKGLSEDPAYTQDLTEDNLVKFMRQHKTGISAQELSYAFGGTTQQQTQFLKKLVDKGVLEKSGRSYKLKKTAADWKVGAEIGDRDLAQIRRTLNLDVVGPLKGLARTMDDGVFTRQRGGLDQDFKLSGTVNDVLAAAKKVQESLSYKVVEAADEEKRTMFEKGKKVKPEEVTKNMSDEEKAEWEANTEKHRDKFKKKDASDWKAVG